MPENTENCSRCDEACESGIRKLSKLQTWTILLIIAVIGMITALLKPADKTEVSEKNFTSVAMGTILDMTFFESAEVAEKAAHAASVEFKKIEDMCSIFKQESEISRLNASAFEKPFVCSNELYSLLKKCREAYFLTDRAFDITAKPLMDLWGFYAKRTTPPTQAQIDEALQKVGMEKVIFNDDEKSVRFMVKGMAFDLGGVAKGAALDKALAAVKNAGAENGIINLGGNIVCFGKNSKGNDFFEVGIRDPHDKNKVIHKLMLKDSFCATSGSYERFVNLNGKTYSHIMDVNSGSSATGTLSATVVTSSGIDSDIYSTACFIRGEQLARTLANNSAISQAVIITYDNNKKTTCLNITKEEKK